MTLGFLFSLVVAAGAAWLMLKIGITFLRGFGAPIQRPSVEEGTLRRVRLHYRCPQCGMQLRIEAAPNDEPLPPRHCTDEMDLVSIDD